MSLGPCLQVLRQHYLLKFVILVSGCLAFAGCGGGDSGGRKPSAEQAQISGSVTNNGKPIPVDSVVGFESAEKSAYAAGKVDSLGKFLLAPADSSVGIPAGLYVVTIKLPSKGSVSPTSTDYKAQMMNPTPVTAPKAASEIPEKFSSTASSPLKLQVKTGPNTFDIDLAKIQ